MPLAVLAKIHLSLGLFDLDLDFLCADDRVGRLSFKHGDFANYKDRSLFLAKPFPCNDHRIGRGRGLKCVDFWILIFGERSLYLEKLRGSQKTASPGPKNDFFRPDLFFFSGSHPRQLFFAKKRTHFGQV